MTASREKDPSSYGRFASRIVNWALQLAPELLMGLPAIYPFEMLPVYHNTNTLAYVIGRILVSRPASRNLKRLDYYGQCLVDGVKAISQFICLTNIQSDHDIPLARRQEMCEKAIEATHCCRAMIEDFAEREDGDPMELGRALSLTHDIERGLEENRAVLTPGYEPARYAARFAVRWPIDDRGRPIAPGWKAKDKKKPRKR